MTGVQRAGLVAALVALGLLPLLLKSYGVYLASLWCVYLMAGFGLNLIVGYAGQMSIGQAAFFGIGAYGVAIGTVDDLVPDQLVRDVLRAAQADLDQVTPAAAHLPQAGAGPVADEDRLPLAGDELLPPENLQVFRVVVIHGPTVRPDRPSRPASLDEREL